MSRSAHAADIGAIVDLDRYPLDRPESPEGRALVSACQAALERDGLFNLEGFLRPDALARALDELGPRMATQTFRQARRHNIYFLPRVEGIEPDHPALAEHETINHSLCADRMAGTVVMAVYEWLPLAAFLAAATGSGPLHLMTDPLARANVMAYRHGEALNWHFDRSPFTTTLLLQAPESGGVFEYRSGLRSDDDPNHDGVARLLAGADPEVRRLPLAPGTLNVFRGRNTAHRVTATQGPRERLIAVYSYYPRPGVRFSAEEQLGFYGRVA